MTKQSDIDGPPPTIEHGWDEPERSGTERVLTRLREWGKHRGDRPLGRSVDFVQYGVGIFLLAIAVVVLIRTAIDFFSSQSNYPQSLIDAIDGVLIVIIVVDILRTVLTHFDGSGFPLRPFLIIGIISAVRDILSVSAHLALQGRISGATFERLAIELVVSSAVALALSGALILTRTVELPLTAAD
jgi:uncharacterized membrane protein (DUF373 family)